MNRFSEIYAKNEWGCGSGEGSLINQTTQYRDYIQNFLKINAISSVVDAGCGDWQSSRLIDWGNTSYYGYDVVSSVIGHNKLKYEANNIHFHHYGGGVEDLPSADLLIIKDVLQHLPNSKVFDFLDILPRYKYALITNCVNPKRATVNNDISIGGFRYMDLRLPPFNLNCKQVLSFNKKESKIKAFLRGYPGWRKIVLLVDNSHNS